jgi:hypothetical protein
MQFKDIRQTARAVSDLVLGVVAITATNLLSREGKVMYAWHNVERTMRIVALDILRMSLVEHSPDEPVDDGWTAVEHDDHVHWIPEPSVLDPMIKTVKAAAEAEMVKQTMQERLNDISSEPLDPQPSVPFDLAAFDMGLDLSSPEALQESLERVIGHPVTMERHEGSVEDGYIPQSTVDARERHSRSSDPSEHYGD